MWNDLEMSIAYAIGLCVRMAKSCPGTTYYRQAKQDAMGMGMKLKPPQSGCDQWIKSQGGEIEDEKGADSSS